MKKASLQPNDFVTSFDFLQLSEFRDIKIKRSERPTYFLVLDQNCCLFRFTITLTEEKLICFMYTIDEMNGVVIGSKSQIKKAFQVRIKA